jgi:hypothetical protein
VNFGSGPHPHQIKIRILIQNTACYSVTFFGIGILFYFDACRIIQKGSVPKDLVEYLKLLLSPTPDLRWVTANCSAALRMRIRLFGGNAHKHQIVCGSVEFAFNCCVNAHQHQIARGNCAFAINWLRQCTLASNRLWPLRIRIKLLATLHIYIKWIAALRIRLNFLRQYTFP